MVSKGLLSEEECRSCAYNHILTRAVGIAPQVQVDSCEVPLSSGDAILICSDGLSDLLTPQDMLAIYQEYPRDLDKIAREMVQTALARGGYDNITLILLLID
jgi:protein phosphatase